jgi:hypothetical protein
MDEIRNRMADVAVVSVREVAELPSHHMGNRRENPLDFGAHCG